MRRARGAAAVLLVLLAAGCGGSRHASTTRSTTRPTQAIFADPKAPLSPIDRGKIGSAHGITIRDVSFAGRHQRVDAYLVLPAKKGRVPAVILLHGSGGSRTDFLGSAITYARRGAVAMTMSAPSDTAPARPSLSPAAQLRRQQSLTIDDVLAVRRAVDFLDRQRSVDPARIGLVGWSAGARTGAVVAGVEPRVRWFVLMSGGALPVSDYVAAAPKSLRNAVRQTLTPIDPLRWIARARPGSVFLEDGRNDQVVPQQALVALTQAAPAGTRVQWYDAGHPLNRTAVRDQIDWLSVRLHIGS